MSAYDPKRTSRAACVYPPTFPVCIRQLLWCLLTGGCIERHRRAANCMPAGDPAHESPGVIAPLSQLVHGRTTDLKSTNAINRDWPASRQLVAPTSSAEGACIEAPASMSIGVAP